ncbi:hypothetical protein Tco_1234355 [Tanacetum coccineum]
MGEALLHGVAKRLNKLDPNFDTDIMVFDVITPKIQYHDVVAKLFGMSLKSFKDIDDFTKDIELGKYPMWSKVTREKHKEVLDTIGDIWDDLVEVCVARDNSSDPLVSKSTKSTSYASVAGRSAKDQPKVSSNFLHLVNGPIFDDVNVSILRKVVEKVSTHFEYTLYGYFIGKRMAFLVVEYYARKNWVKHGLKRIMMNNKGLFFFKFNSQAGLEAILEGVLGRSSFTRCSIEVNSEVDLMDVVTISIPSLTGDDFTKETIYVEYEWRPPSPPIVPTTNVVIPTVEMNNDGYQTMSKKKKKKGQSKSTNGGQFTGPLVK